MKKRFLGTMITMVLSAAMLGGCAAGDTLSNESVATVADASSTEEKKADATATTEATTAKADASKTEATTASSNNASSNNKKNDKNTETTTAKDASKTNKETTKAVEATTAAKKDDKKTEATTAAKKDDKKAETTAAEPETQAPKEEENTKGGHWETVTETVVVQEAYTSVEQVQVGTETVVVGTKEETEIIPEWDEDVTTYVTICVDQIPVGEHLEGPNESGSYAVITDYEYVYQDFPYTEHVKHPEQIITKTVDVTEERPIYEEREVYHEAVTKEVTTRVWVED